MIETGCPKGLNNEQMSDDGWFGKVYGVVTASGDSHNNGPL